MSNQPRPFSWFRLAPFGRQVQPTRAPAPPPTPQPTAFRAPVPQPFSSPAPQPRAATRPPAVTSPPPPPTRAFFPGITSPTAPRSPTPSTAPPSPSKSITTTSIPASPITKENPSSSPTGTSTFLPITFSSFTLRSPETNKPTPYSPFPKPAASPPKTAPPPASPAPTTTTLSSRMIKPLNESPPKYPETKPLFRPPAQARAAPQEEKKLMLGQETAGNSKMNEKSTAIDNKKVTKLEILPRRLVTLIGENKGAIMVLNPNFTKKSYTNVFGGKSQTVGKKEEGNTVEGEKGSKKMKEDQSDMNTMEMEESTLFINSNVQGINNSILDDSSLTHHDPGFHIFFSTD
ncbi:hypothetical protein K7X08_036155 [Anisodus acutangulus]|uniref:Uncharacterized protein n=1 Tax=Anisodus acutangulus TaxID=402998 RepID=A0A9Q1L7Z9_9SOLA|nr:hypothetical protein K7X08_036155 [Anisodus acutangulus]